MYIKKLPSQDRIKELFSYDSGTGVLKWAVRKTMRKAIGSDAGGVNGSGYITIRIDNSAYLAHRLIWKMHHGEDPEIIDHINRNRMDNRLSNLRSGTCSENACNKPLSKHNTSGIKGVSWSKEKKKWHAQISMHRIAIRLGYFDCPAVAGLLFQKACRLRDRLHENAKLYRRLAVNHGIYMLPVTGGANLAFKDDELTDAIHDVFGE